MAAGIRVLWPAFKMRGEGFLPPEGRSVARNEVRGERPEVTDGLNRIALKTHGDDKAVVLAHVAMLGFVNLHDTDIEERRVDDLYGTVGGFGIDRAIVGLDMEVQGLGSQSCVELTRLAIETRAIVVEDAIGDIR